MDKVEFEPSRPCVAAAPAARLPFPERTAGLRGRQGSLNRLLKRALDLGITLLDTANVYGRGAHDPRAISDTHRCPMPVREADYGCPNCWKAAHDVLVGPLKLDPSAPGFSRAECDWVLWESNGAFQLGIAFGYRVGPSA